MLLPNSSIHFIISDSGYLVVKLHFGHVYFHLIGIDSTHGWTATTRYGVHLPKKICKCWFAKTLVIHLEWFIWNKKYKYLKKELASLSGHLEVSALLDVRHVCFILVQYQGKLMMQPWVNGKNSNFGPNLGLQKFFFRYFRVGVFFNCNFTLP